MVPMVEPPSAPPAAASAASKKRRSEKPGAKRSANHDKKKKKSETLVVARGNVPKNWREIQRLISSERLVAKVTVYVPKVTPKKRRSLSDVYEDVLAAWPPDTESITLEGVQDGDAA